MLPPVWIEPRPLINLWFQVKHYPVEVLYLLGFTWKPLTTHSLPIGSQCKSSEQFPPEHNSN